MYVHRYAIIYPSLAPRYLLLLFRGAGHVTHAGHEHDSLRLLAAGDVRGYPPFGAEADAAHLPAHVPGRRGDDDGSPPPPCESSDAVNIIHFPRLLIAAE